MAKYATFDIYPRHLRPVPWITIAVAENDDLQRAADEWCARQDSRLNLPDGTLRAQMRHE